MKVNQWCFTSFVVFLDVMLSDWLGKLRSAFNCLPYLKFLQSKYCNTYCRTACCIIAPTRIYNMHFNTQRQTTPFGFSLLFQSSCQNVRFSGSVALFICFASFYLILSIFACSIKQAVWAVVPGWPSCEARCLSPIPRGAPYNQKYSDDSSDSPSVFAAALSKSRALSKKREA